MQDWLSLFDFQNTRRVTPGVTTTRPVVLINRVDLLHFGQCCGFLQGSILVAFGVATLCQTWDNFKASLNIFANRIRW